MSDVPQLISVRCTHCGAPLELPPSARFVTCAHCGSQLQVHHNGNAVYTEKLDQIAASTQRIVSDVQAIKRQNEIEALDREWQARRQSVLGRNAPHGSGKGAAASAFVFSAIAATMGIGVIIATTAMDAPIIMRFSGLMFIALGCFPLTQIGKLRQFERDEADYRRRRRELEQALNDGSRS